MESESCTVVLRTIDLVLMLPPLDPGMKGKQEVNIYILLLLDAVSCALQASVKLWEAQMLLYNDIYLLVLLGIGT